MDHLGLINGSFTEPPGKRNFKYKSIFGVESESVTFANSRAFKRLQEILERRKDLKTFNESSSNFMRFQKDS